MSAFGIGINTQAKNAGVIRGNQKEISCDCWFTAKGKLTPRMIKFSDENGEVQTIKEIRINYM